MSRFIWFLIALILIVIAAFILAEKDVEQIEETAEKSPE
jgi:hypothetical protein